MVTVNPPSVEGEPDSKRKRRLYQIVYHLGQDLMRKGQPQLFFAVCQKMIGERLHYHAVFRLNPKHVDVLQRAHQLPDVMVQKWDHNVGYLTRQRLPAGPPEFEKSRPWGRRKGQPIRGKLLTIHRDLKDLVIAVEHERYAKPATAEFPDPQPVASAAIEFSDAVKPEQQQLALFPALPAAMPAEFDLAAERQRLGLSQYALARLVGLKQPHVANVERGHDRLSSARLKAVRHVLASLAVAA